MAAGYRAHATKQPQHWVPENGVTTKRRHSRSLGAR